MMSMLCGDFRKFATYACTFGAAVFSVLYTTYTMPPHLEGRKHVFTDVQESYHKMVDKYIWGLPPKDMITKERHGVSKVDETR